MVPFSDYPSPAGNKLECIGEITGPTSYTAVTGSTPPAAPTVGVQLAAADIGLTEIEYIEFMGSNDGRYSIIAFPNQTGKACTSVTLMILTAATGAQITTVDLSALKFRFRAVGR